MESARLSPANKSPGATWLDHIEGAMTSREVMEIVAAYLESRDIDDIATLPRCCLPPRLLTQPEDVVDYAFAVVQHHCANGANPVVGDLASFLGSAARKIAVLMGERSRPISAVNDLRF